MWVRLHRVPRTTLFVPGEQLQGGPVLSDLSGARVTITLGDYGSMMLSEDVWTSVKSHLRLKWSVEQLAWRRKTC